MLYPNVVLYCAQECERQHTTPLAVFDMVNAWRYTRMVADGPGPDLLTFIQSIAGFVDVRNKDGYRRSHVGFISGGKAAPVDEIDGQMGQLFTFADEWLTPSDVEAACKSILQIHPWIDGNGRTVSIFRNLLMGTLDEPEMLPFYFGE